ncbi:MAG: hypothetical protein IPJ19_02765 [Planctomycetes bacterium]|nr:hypothetical protein [Planctomycetota bacterium]
MTYTWTQTSGPTVVLDDAHAASPTFTAPEGLTNTTLVFQLAVSDGTNVSYDTVTIDVNRDNDAPTAEAGPAQSVDENDVVTLAGSGVDPEGQSLTYTWTQTSGPTVVLDDAHAGSPTFTAPEGLTNTTLTFQLAVSDGTNVSYDTVTIDVNRDNDAPTAEAGPAQSVDENDVVTLAGSGVDPEGQSLTYTWTQTSGPTVVLDDAHAGSPTFTAPEGLTNTTLTFQLAVSDGTNVSYDTVTIDVNRDNDAPTAEAGPAQSVDENDVVTLAGSGVDLEGQSLTYTWTQTSGPTVVLDDAHAGSPTFTAPEGLTNTSLSFQLAVSDGTNVSYDTVTIDVNRDNDAPTAEAGPALSVGEDDVVTLVGSGVDPEGQSLTYTWTQTSGPTVVLDDAHASSPSFAAPAVSADAVLTFQLAVSDGTSTSFDTVSVAVHDVEHPPVVDAGGVQTVDENSVVALEASATSPDGNALSFTWTQISGPAVELSDAHSATPSFTTPELVSNTTLVFQLSVSDGTSTSVDTVEILVHANDDAPTAEAGPDQEVQAGERTTIEGSSSDAEGAQLQYAWQQVGGPAIEIADPHSANLSFVAPSVAQPTELVFEFAVSDGTTTSIDTVRVVVGPASAALEAGSAAPGVTAGNSPAAAQVIAQDVAAPAGADEMLPEFGSDDLAVLAPQVEGLSVELDLSHASLDQVEPALPTAAHFDPSRLRFEDMQVERLVLDPLEPVAPLPSQSAFTELQQRGTSFENTFERVGGADDLRAGEHTRAASTPGLRSEQPDTAPEFAQSGLLAGLYGLLRSAAGTLGWPTAEKPSELPTESSKDERKS